MLLQGLALKEAGNISDSLLNSSSEITKSVLAGFLKTIGPILTIVGGLLGLYIIYKIIQAISNHLMKKRIKRIEERVQETNGKVNEILNILKKKKKSK